MSPEEKHEYILKLDEELLLGGSIISEWSAFLVRDASDAYCSGANLAAILASQAGMECHLRYEYFCESKTKLGFFELIEQSPIPTALKTDLHKIRRYRNKWVHVNDPTADEDLLQRPEKYEAELEKMAKFSIRAMMHVIYLEQWV